jgi:putative peptidoglycan lipid II flippase
MQPPSIYKSPILMAWVVFAAYSASASLIIQFLALPLIFPEIHAGNGLLIGSDSVQYHTIASRLAQSIHEFGWSQWTLSPEGQPAAGLAAPFYFLFGESPWSVIPINAFLHATTGIAVLHLARQLDVEWGAACIAGFFWIALPSSLQWVAQIQKDGYFFAGILGALVGWTMALRIVRGTAANPSALLCAGLLFSGTAIAGVARPYSLQISLVVSAFFLAIAIPLAIINTRRKKIERSSCVGIVIAIAGLTCALAACPHDIRLEPALNRVESAGMSVEFIDGKPWRPSSWLPSFIDNAFMQIAIARRGYLSSSYSTAGSMADLRIQFHSAGESVAYLPRAVQIGFLAPFPEQWFSPGASPGGTIMRFVAGLEMIILYPLLIIGLPLAAWKWRTRPEFWMIAFYCSAFVVIYAWATPNIGSLYRFRFGFLTTLAALGFAAIWSYGHHLFNRKN